MRRPLIVAVALAALLAGCGRDDGGTPAACLQGAGPYLEALQDAPGTVRLAAETTIGSCLVEDQAAGQLSRVGLALVRAATELNASARADRGGAAGVRLGYLVGAVQSGAAQTGGIHTDLVRRVEAAAEFRPSGQAPAPAFEAAYRRGLAAGRAGG